MPGERKSSPAVDVLVIGGGIIGCSIAFRLAQGRLKVTVLDRGELGGEASNAAAGMLAPQGEMVEPDAFFELCATSRDLYPSFVAEIEELSGERVGYRRDGTLLVATDDEECAKLENLHRVQSRLGLPLERLNAQGVHERVQGLSSEIRCGLFVPGDHWLDNERLMRGLVTACRRVGVRFLAGSAAARLIVENGHVLSVETDPTHSGAASGSAEARASHLRTGATISGGQFVLAAGCWSGALAESLGVSLPIKPCRGQLVEFESSQPLPLVVRSGMNYLVPRSDGCIVAGTTAEYAGYEKAVTGEGLRSILERVTRMAPLVKDLRFRRAWAGLRPDTADHLPILGYGELTNLVFATGHFRNGILLAPVTAQLISELLLNGATSQSIAPYRPTRFA